MNKKQQVVYGLLTVLSILLFVAFAFSVMPSEHDSVEPPVITALAVKKNPVYGQYVTLEGSIVEEPERRRYIFSDESGSIPVEIFAHAFRNQRVTSTTPIKLLGKVETDLQENTKISVKRLSVIYHDE